MMHKEVVKPSVLSYVFLLTYSLLTFRFLSASAWLAALIAMLFFGLVVQFIRNPACSIANIDDNLIYTSANAKIIIIEVTEEDKFLNEKSNQISIFLSLIYVCMHRIPFSGLENYFKYRPSKFLLACHPKSSAENERMDLVIEEIKIGHK